MNAGGADSVPLRPVRRVGPGEWVVGQCEGWLLVRRRKHSSSGDWWNLKLYRTVPSRKAVYWLSYNGVEHRMARCADQDGLEEHDPLIADWVWLVARKRAVPG